METVAWFTVVIAGAIIATAALGLVRVILHLVAVKRTLESLLGGVDVVRLAGHRVPAPEPAPRARVLRLDLSGG